MTIRKFDIFSPPWKTRNPTQDMTRDVYRGVYAGHTKDEAIGMFIRDAGGISTATIADVANACNMSDDDFMARLIVNELKS